MSVSPDDLMEFADDGPAEATARAATPAVDEAAPVGEPWQILVVDDDPGVISVTRLVLNNVTYKRRGIRFFEAASGREAIEVMKREPEIAVVLLDVVMETEDAGLTVVKRIRDELVNDKVRVLLRTGQPGSAPERNVVLSYDINDYLAKQELTHDRLITSVVTAIRSYQTLKDSEQAFRDLSRAHSRLVEMEKMAALGELVAGITHEVATPLGTCIQAASHLRETCTDTRRLFDNDDLSAEEFVEFLQAVETSGRIIQTAVENASRLMDGFKTIAVDRASGARRVFQLKPLIDDILLGLSPRTKRLPHVIEVSCPETLELDGFPGALNQILTNFVMNSLIHGFDSLERPGRIEIRCALMSDLNLQITYKDDGKGIAPENLQRIFEPYFTTRRGAGGSGLGLSVVQSLVTETLGGSIECTSVPGEGVLFTIIMPARAP